MHLVVVQHGLWGNHGNTKYLADLLHSQLGDGYIILNSHVSNGNLTYDGIDVCGDRLHVLILETVEQLASKGTPVHAISLVGYSMGGLIQRYVAGKLYADGFFSRVRPVNLMTVATPHLGAWRLPSSWFNRAFNYMVPVVTSRTGYQLVLQDKHTWGKPLLCLMSHPGLVFMRAAQQFERLMLMANVFHDRPVPYCTAAIRLDNPYEKVQPVAVDPRYPCIVRPSRTAVGPSGKHCTLAAAGGVAGAGAGVGVEGSSGKGAGGCCAKPATRSIHGAPVVGGGGSGNGSSSNGAAAASGGGVVAVASPLYAGPNPGAAAGQGQGAGDVEQQQQNGLESVGGGKEQEQQQQQQRPLRSTYLRYMMLLLLPLALPVLALMTFTGRRHYAQIASRQLDFSWIERFHTASESQKAGEGFPSDQRGKAGQEEGGREKPPAAAAAAGERAVAELVGTEEDAEDVEACPSAPLLPAAVTATAAGAGGVEGKAGAGAGGGGGGAALDEDGEDGVVEADPGHVLRLHDGVAGVPGELHAVQEWLVEQLNTLPWLKVDVDCRDLHAHAAIVLRHPARFMANRDTMDYLVDNFLRA